MNSAHVSFTQTKGATMYKDNYNLLPSSKRRTKLSNNSSYNILNTSTANGKRTREPMDTMQVFQHLTPMEKNELEMNMLIYYHGQKCRQKYSQPQDYDDSRGDYQLLIGDHLVFRYEILKVLGKGSFGQVALCLDHKSGLQYAIKIIRNKKRFHTQALIEIKILEHLKLQQASTASKSIISIEGHFYYRQHLCIMFPLCHQNLYEFLKANNFVGCSIDVTREFCTQIVDCLAILGKCGIIHSDLKPENLMLVNPSPPIKSRTRMSRSGSNVDNSTSGNMNRIDTELKVIDFGSSCFQYEKIYTYIQSRFYRSPEIILGIPYSTPIDMWSLGCILVEMYSGYPIFPAANELELLGLIIEVFGNPPLDLLLKSTRRKLFFHANYVLRMSISSHNNNGKGGPNNVARSVKNPYCRPLESILRYRTGDISRHNEFVDFVRRCLTWDPEMRLTPTQALLHPYITLLQPMQQPSLQACLNESPTAASLSGMSSMYLASPTVRGGQGGMAMAGSNVGPKSDLRSSMGANRKAMPSYMLAHNNNLSLGTMRSTAISHTTETGNSYIATSPHTEKLPYYTYNGNLSIMDPFNMPNSLNESSYSESGQSSYVPPPKSYSSPQQTHQKIISSYNCQKTYDQPVNMTQYNNDITAGNHNHHHTGGHRKEGWSHLFHNNLSKWIFGFKHSLSKESLNSNSTSSSKNSGKGKQKNYGNNKYFSAGSRYDHEYP